MIKKNYAALAILREIETRMWITAANIMIATEYSL